jgi:hypothetical protein
MSDRIALQRVSLFFAVLLTLTAAGAARAQDAGAIMQGVYQQDTSRDTSLRARLDVTAADGQTARKRFILLRKVSPGGNKTLARFSDPAEIRGVALLSLDAPGAAPQQWIYVPAQQRSRSVTPRERSERFVDSDFTYEDIGAHVLGDFSYRLLASNEVMDGHKAYKIAAIPVSADRSQYKFVYYWVAQDVPVILNAEMYDTDGHEVRVLHASDLKRESGIWGARHIEMQTLADKTKTVLTIDEARFNTGLDDSIFTPDGMSKAPMELKGAGGGSQNP